MPWEAGVDVFFVISGFVMLHASEGLFGTGSVGIQRFLARRIARIVPLYWAMTTLFLIVTAVSPASVTAPIGDFTGIVTSYAFIPRTRPDGLVQPPYGLGWTLNYEMFFYLSFAACLWMRRSNAILCLTFGLCALVAAGVLIGFASVALHFWSEPIVLEFLFGVWIRAALPRVAGASGWIRAGLVAVAIAIFHADFASSGTPRVIGYGLPAALLVLASVTGPRARVSAWTTIAVRIGDASYAIYLVHPFVMRAGSLAAHRLGLQSTEAVLAYIVLCLIATCLAALAVNTYTERPATRQLRRWLEPA